MNIEGLVNKIKPYEISGTLEDLAHAKKNLDNHIHEFKGLERLRIAESSARLLGEIGDLLESQEDKNPFQNSDEQDDDVYIITIRTSVSQEY